MFKNKYSQENTLSFEKAKGNTFIDAYNFYKKNEQAAQDAISSLDFTSAQNTSAKIGNTVMSNFSKTHTTNYKEANMNTTIQEQNSTSVKSRLLKPSLMKGLLLGAGLALVATNPRVQKAVVGTGVKLWSSLQGHIEEMKEQVQDAKAELAQEDE